MSSLGKRMYGGGPSGYAKRARGAPAAIAKGRAPRVSGRYNRSMSSRLQRAPGMSRETGFVDVALGTYNMDTTGSIVLLNTIAQGASVNQRVGKKIVLKGLQARGRAFNGTTATSTDNAFMIVYDKRPTGALPAITDILVTASADAFNNDANSGRFTILKRSDLVLLGNETAPANYTTEMTKDCSFYLPMKGLQTVFKAAGTGAIGDIEEGALYLVAVGNRAAGTTAAILSLGFRMRFVDV